MMALLKHTLGDDRPAASRFAARRYVHVLPGVYQKNRHRAASGGGCPHHLYFGIKVGAQIIGDVIDHSAWDNRGDYVYIILLRGSVIGRTGL